MNKLFFARKTSDVKLPSKRVEDAGYDIYAYTEEDSITIGIHETKLIPTGVFTAISDDFVIVVKDRGSNHFGLQTMCGVIDSGYRGEIFIALTNTTDKKIIISKDSEKTTVLEDVILYPLSKGIAQLLVLPVPKMTIEELTIEELQAIPSERGTGKIGSSGK